MGGLGCIGTTLVNFIGCLLIEIICFAEGRPKLEVDTS